MHDCRSKNAVCVEYDISEYVYDLSTDVVSSRNTNASHEPPCALPFTGAIVNINPMIAASGILAGVWGRFQVRSTPNHLRPLTPLTETIDFGPFERVFVNLLIIEISHGKHPPP